MLGPHVEDSDQMHDPLSEHDIRLDQYAVVSRVWQGVVERYTFARLNITSSEMLEFSDMVGRCPLRRTYLRSIDVLFYLHH